MRSLTQHEAETRAALLEVRRYDIAVDLTDLPTGPAVRCTSRITFVCRKPGQETFVDCAADVLSATLNGQALPKAEDGRIALTGLEAENTLVVASEQTRTKEGEGVHKAVDAGDGEVYLWMSFEPDEARHVWACFDQPDLKAPHALTVTAPGAWRVISNMEHTDVAEQGDARTWTFRETPPLSTYNPVVLAGPFHEIRREAGGYDLGILARRSLAGALERDADELFTLTEQGLEFFGRVFAMPFPERKYDQVFVPEMGGAMENYGCVTWSDSVLRRVPPTAAELELLAKFLLHEMAHMWFGNIVTMRWWDDLWLNEAFAELACLWSAERATRYTDAWAGHLAEDKLDAYLMDQGPASHPIRQPIHDVEQAMSIFDAITYPKGASVLQQLMTYLGEEHFSAGMARYFAENAWGSTTLQDLMDTLAAVSGKDLDAWRRGWLETAGTDRLTLEQDGAELTLVAQGPGGPPRPHVLAVGAYRRTTEGLERITLDRVEVAGERTALDLPAAADLYLVNDDDLTFATARPDPASRSVLLESAGELPTAISRGVAVATVWDMLVTGDARADEVVRCIAGVLLTETADTVIEPYLRLAGDAAELWSPDTQRLELMAVVAETCRTLAENPARRQVALRGLARTARDGEEVAWLQDAAGDDVDLLWRALVRKAEVASVDDGEIAELLERDDDPDAWVRALTVRVARPTKEAKAELWQAAVEKSVPVGDFGPVATAFWRPGQEEVLRPYADKYLDLLPRLDEGGMIPAMVYSGRLFPLHAFDQDFLDRALGRATDDSGEVAPVVRKRVLEKVDERRRMLVARSSTTG